MSLEFKAEKRIYSYMILVVGIISFAIVLLTLFLLIEGMMDLALGIVAIIFGCVLSLLSRAYWSMEYILEERNVAIRGNLFTRGLNAFLYYRIPFDDITDLNYQENQRLEGSKLTAALKAKRRVFKKFITGNSPVNVVISTRQLTPYFIEPMNLGYVVSPKEHEKFMKELKSRISS